MRPPRGLAGASTATWVVAAVTIVSTFVVFNYTWDIAQESMAQAQRHDEYYPGDVNVPSFSSLVLDERGHVRDFAAASVIPAASTDPFLTYQNTSLPNARRLTVGGGTLQASLPPGEMHLSLLPRPAAAGTFANPTVTIGPDGVVHAAVAGPPLTIDSVATDTGTLRQAIESNVLVTQPSLHLPGSKVLEVDPYVFTSLVVNGSMHVALRPQPLAGGFTCVHPSLIVFDNVTGLTAACASSVAPGLPNGPATLDNDGKLNLSQLPDDFFRFTPRGAWDAAANAPYLNDSSCGANDTFSYIVSANGNSTLGAEATWLSGDLALCINGTWTRISFGGVFGVSSFNGRDGAVAPEAGDYDATMIPFGAFFLDSLLGASILTTGPVPMLPASQMLAGVAGQTVAAGAAVGLAPKINFPLPLNPYAGLLCDVTVDEHGRFDSAATCPIAQFVNGTAGQITVTGTTYITLSLEQSIATTSTPTFAGIILAPGALITATGTSPITFPDAGVPANVVLTEGAQLVNGLKSFSAELQILGDAGLSLWNAANTFKTTLFAAAALAANTVFRLPPTNGVARDLLMNMGGGATAWKAFERQQALSTTGVALATLIFAPFPGMSIVLTNAAPANYVFWFSASASSSLNNIPVEVRILVNGAAVPSQIARYNAQGRSFTVSMHGILAAVPAGATVAMEVRSLGVTTLTLGYRNLMLEEVQ